MKYMLLIYGPAEGDFSPEAVQAEMSAYWEYEKAVAEAGVVRGSEALGSVETATTVAVRYDAARPRNVMRADEPVSYWESAALGVVAVGATALALLAFFGRRPFRGDGVATFRPG